MNFPGIGFAVTSLFFLPVLAAAADGTFQRTLAVHGQVTVEVATGSGSIHISPGSDKEVHVVGHVHASRVSFGSYGSPEQRVKEVVDNPPIDQAGNTIRIGKRNEHLHNVSIDYDLTLPANAHVVASTGSGDIRAEHAGVDARLTTGSGSITAQGLAGAVTLGTGSGDIHANLSGTGDVKLTTGSGSILVDGVKGALFAETGSGDIEAHGSPASAWTLHTGSGSITMVAGSSPYTLDAATGSGSVHTDIPITVDGNLGRNHVSGKVSGGGPLVRIHTGSGNIHVR